MITNSISSLIFTSNVLMLYLHQQPIYATLMAILTITSVYNHMVETKTSAIIDKIAVYLVVIYGGFVYYHKNISNR